ncbi:chromosome segregation protein Csm1/Pcs1-domain-containing protein [Scheffersomyces coipomensis]|uniref:chromosome segregation protein Csm1/Pcs1-domain-containing protein n=1 Tax=Scheffersomyces coipomensis TaxID=1788519 RepID=UPI00315DA062
MPPRTRRLTGSIAATSASKSRIATTAKSNGEPNSSKVTKGKSLVASKTRSSTASTISTTTTKPSLPGSGKSPVRLVQEVQNIKTSSTPKSTPKSTPHKNKISLIASPSSVVKKKFTSSIISEEDVLESNRNHDLVEFINSLVNTKRDDLFTNYQAKAQSQIKNDHELIKQLNEEVSEKQSTIDKLLNEIEQLKLSENKPIPNPKLEQVVNDVEYLSPIRSRKHKIVDMIDQQSIKKEFEDIGFTLDMLELLTGLRIVNFTEDDDKYYFDVKQTTSNSSDVVYISYRLIVSKTFESTAEIEYIPTFLEDLDSEEDEYADDDDDNVRLGANENARYLKKMLPDYLCENLSFPYNTLSQFYAKVNRALHKGSKG